MKFPLIKVRDVGTGGQSVHIVGTNTHDSLVIVDGGIHYLDMQSMAGTLDEEGEFEFVPSDWYLEEDFYDAGPPEIEFVELEELIRIAIENSNNQTRDAKRFDRLYRKWKRVQKRNERRRKHLPPTTSGMTF